MGTGRWTTTTRIAAVAAFAIWVLTFAAARHMVREARAGSRPRAASRHRHEPAPSPQPKPAVVEPRAPRGHGVASSSGRAAAESEARIRACEAAWSDWVLKRDGVELRDLTFRVVADEEFRARTGAGWEKDVRARMARASAVFEREFRVRFVVASVGEWQSEDAAASIHDLHAALARRTGGGAEDVVIGFSSQHAPARAGAAPDVYDRGVAYYFGRCCIVRAGTPPAGDPWPYEDETVLHEIGHVFGAWHSTHGRSVMRAIKQGPENAGFDVYARAAVLSSRTVDFRRGTDAVDDATVATLFAAWKVSHPGDAEFPPWQALCTEAWWARESGDADGAARRCDRALDMDRRLGPFERTADVRELLTWAEARKRR